MLHTLAGRALGHSVIAGRLRKTSPPHDIVKDFERSDMHSPMGTGSSVIYFVNSRTPLLNLPIPRIPSAVEGVKKQFAYFCAAVWNDRDNGIALQA